MTPEEQELRNRIIQLECERDVALAEAHRYHQRLRSLVSLACIEHQAGERTYEMCLRVDELALLKARDPWAILHETVYQLVDIINRDFRTKCLSSPTSAPSLPAPKSTPTTQSGADS